MNLQPIFIRENIIKSIREFFYSRQFHEIITPTFNDALPLEPTIYAFQTTWQTVHGVNNLYLSTSPESGLKKMIAQGMENCFAIAKSFRNLEDSGATHIPEFLMAEWYRKNATFQDIMDDTQNLIQFVSKGKTCTYQNHEITFPDSWPRRSIISLFTEYASVNVEQLLDDTSLRNAAQKKGYSTEDATWEQLFNQIFLNEIEPTLGMDPCFITDFPSRISPLCARKKDQPDFAERFEVYIGGLEIGNGNTENTDTNSIRSVFENELHSRKSKNMSAPPIDTAFLDSLDIMKTQSFAGIGLGIDRLAMIFSDSTVITEVDPLAIY
jgi:elongation factor P--(R)-beta-lysine ligase